MVLALIKLAATDPDNAAAPARGQMGHRSSRPKSATGSGASSAGSARSKLCADCADSYFAKVTETSDLSDDMLAWKVRAALRAAHRAAVAGRACRRRRHERRRSAETRPGSTGRPAPCWPAAARTRRGRGPAAVRDRIASRARLLRAAGAGGTGPEDHRAAPAGAAHGRGEKAAAR